MVMELANETLTITYCGDCERRRERRAKTVSFKRYTIVISSLSRFQRERIVISTGKFVEGMRMMIIITKG